MSKKKTTAEPQPEQPPRFFARTFPLSTQIVTAVAVVFSVVCLIVAASDGYGDLGWASGFMWAAAIPTAWSVLQPLWRPDPVIHSVYASMIRTIFVPIVVAPIIAIANSIVVLLPPISALIAKGSRPNGSHYYFPDESGHPLFQTLILGGVAGVAVAMLVGLALSIFVVIPWFAIRRPLYFAAANALDTSAEHAKVNTVAARFLGVVIVLAFLVPGLIIVGSREARAKDFAEVFTTWTGVFTDPQTYWGDALWFAGIVLVPVGIIATIIVRVIQRPDHAARAASGTQALGDTRPPK